MNPKEALQKWKEQVTSVHGETIKVKSYDNDEYVQLGTEICGGESYLYLTPESARRLAVMLVKSADKAEKARKMALNGVMRT